ncbi:MAG: helix-turn-helix domain-containing protein [Oligoflexales bacterium]|nr:helix-turn-helix domain-containing protein [Oligoflexales bacterium]
MEDKNTSFSESHLKMQKEEKRRALGLRLQEMRQAKGISCKEIEHETRIAINFITALEAGNFDALPARVFGRGFIKSIGKALNTDCSAFLTSYDECWDEDPRPNRLSRSETRMRHWRSFIPQRKRHTKNTGLALFNYFTFGRLLLPSAAVLALGTLVYSLFSYQTQPPESDATSKISQESAATANEPIEVQGLKDSLESKPTTELKAETEVAGKDASPSPSPSSTDLTPNTVVIEVKQEVRIKQQVGDRSEIKSYQPGRYTFIFQDKIDFYVFDISAVEIFFNGKKLGPLGLKGEERKLSFHSKSLDVKPAEKSPTDKVRL